MTTLTELSSTVGFIGAGNMAAALVRGLVAAGLPTDHILLTDVDTSKSSALAQELSVRVADDASALAKSADIILLCVKPPVIVPVLEELAAQADGKLWISIAAGVPLARMQEALGSSARLIRAMPNTPALVGAGATGLAAGSHATADDRKLALALLGATGLTVEIAEGQMDALTGLSGSGPAYIMLIIEALADGGVRAGLPRKTAVALAAQTVYGAGKLVIESGQHPAQLKDAVTSPGGTTIAGVEALEARGLRGTMMQAVQAAAARSVELSRG